MSGRPLLNQFRREQKRSPLMDWMRTTGFEVAGEDQESQLQSRGGLFSRTASGPPAQRSRFANLDQERLPPRCFIAPERPEHGPQQSPLDHKRHGHATNKRRTDYHRIHYLERT